jgi:hypothetical protein
MKNPVALSKPSGNRLNKKYSDLIMAQENKEFTSRLIKYKPIWWKRSIFNPGDGLYQIEFSQNKDTFLFPDFDNIFSRSDAVKEWWFLSPESGGKSILESEEDINQFWKQLQDIYSKSILNKVEPSKRTPLGFQTISDRIVYLLYIRLRTKPLRTEMDDHGTSFSMCYYYAFFHDLKTENNWHRWLLSKSTVDYYHGIFAPDLNIELDELDDQKIRRLHNRFPEYAFAFEWLKDMREKLYEATKRDWQQREEVDRFFATQRDNTLNVSRKENKIYGQIVPPIYCQCRVCGVIFLPDIKRKGDGKRIGDRKKICSDQCKKAWEVFGKSLPQNPEDEEGRNFHLSQL